ncbi:arylamine N-acetyltransferase family protein [Sphaerisporangium aureirubrum]|uniref:Arylamine N-acetyltransferase n=1 Tax=Sphaerisporangium aureirubrum TaxID=1544736 RepID=A0ABW1NRS8_9ACTN
MEPTQVDAYLARIGAARPASPDEGALRALQLAHLTAVPFENLSIHLGEPIVLKEEALFDKIVSRGRGGFCYELNGTFGALLRALGYRVSLLSARVFDGEEPGPPFDHLVLRVDVEEPWLVDVGYGRFSDHPLRLDHDGDQHDPGGVFSMIRRDEYGDIDVVQDDSLEYRVDPRPYGLRDFVPTCWWHQTSPKSHFTRSLTCSRRTGDGRITLSGRTLIETSAGGERRESELGSDDDVLAAYQAHFGITLDRVPVIVRREAS